MCLTQSDNRFSESSIPIFVSFCLLCCHGRIDKRQSSSLTDMLVLLNDTEVRISGVARVQTLRGHRQHERRMVREGLVRGTVGYSFHVLFLISLPSPLPHFHPPPPPPEGGEGIYQAIPLCIATSLIEAIGLRAWYGTINSSKRG